MSPSVNTIPSILIPGTWHLASRHRGCGRANPKKFKKKGGNIWKKKLFKCSLKLLRIYLFIYPDMCTRRIPLITD